MVGSTLYRALDCQPGTLNRIAAWALVRRTAFTKQLSGSEMCFIDGYLLILSQLGRIVEVLEQVS